MFILPALCRSKEVYDPKTFILHAVSLHQSFLHCAIFLVAAIRRCRGRVSVPLWLTDLSVQLPVIALVGHYPTNKLIGRRPLPLRTVTCFVLTKTYSISPAFAGVSYTKGYVPTRYSPVRRSPPCGGALDLHALGTPPAFILNQDQILKKIAKQFLQPANKRSSSRVRIVREGLK